MLLNEIPFFNRGTFLAQYNPHRQNCGDTKNKGDEKMELRPYYDRPISTIDAYVTEILSAVAANFRHWGEYKFVWPKQGYGKGVLRSDQFSILGTFGQWLVPSSGSSGNPNQVTVDSYGWAQRVLDFKTLEEFYYLIMGIQYPVSPLLITEHQWRISGVETPVIDQQLFEVLEEPFVWYEMPVIVEPEKTIVCAHRVVGGLASYGNSTIAGAEKWRVIGSVIGQHHELIQQRQSIGELS